LQTFGSESFREEHSDGDPEYISDQANVAELLADQSNIAELTRQACEWTLELLKEGWDRVIDIAEVHLKHGRWVPEQASG
jgi:hypothetical protein